MEFKGKQGKLSVEEIKEDNYVHLINENGKSVASISTNERQYKEALIYAKLFSKAPEMIEFIIHVFETMPKGSTLQNKARILIEKTLL